MWSAWSDGFEALRGAGEMLSQLCRVFHVGALGPCVIPFLSVLARVFEAVCRPQVRETTCSAVENRSCASVRRDFYYKLSRL